MERQIKLTFTVGDSDDAGARYVTASLGDRSPKDLGTLTPWPGSDLGPPFRFRGHPIGGPHPPLVTGLESEGQPYASVEDFVAALKNALLPP